MIFEAACTALGLPPEQCVHVGDDRRWGARGEASGSLAWRHGLPAELLQLPSACCLRWRHRFLHCCSLLHPVLLPLLPLRNDLYGARDSGCFAWLWGQDVFNFEQVERRLATGNLYDSLTDV